MYFHFYHVLFILGVFNQLQCIYYFYMNFSAISVLIMFSVNISNTISGSMSTSKAHCKINALINVCLDYFAYIVISKII